MENDVMKILIVDDMPETREMLRKLLAFETDIEVVGAASTGREAIALTNEFEPDIIPMDINMPDMDGIAATKAIKEMHPAAGIIIMSVQNESEYLRRAMMAGARDFVSKPISGDTLHEAILRVYGLQAEERSQQSTMKSSSATVAAAKAKATGHIIAIYSPQGGAGVTTIATNVAVSLMRKGTRVALIDADLQWGDVGVFLNLSSKYTICDLTNAMTELEQNLIENVMVGHDSGLKVLLAPYEMEDAERIIPGNVATVIQEVAQYYDYVIVDMPKHLDETALSILDSAECIVVIATPTLPSIKSSRILLNLFTRLDYPPEKIMFVMNRVSNDARAMTMIPLDSIESNLKRTIDARIPLDESAFLSAVNKGVSVIAMDQGKSPAADLMQLADKVHLTFAGSPIETMEVIPQSRSRLSNMWSGLTG